MSSCLGRQPVEQELVAIGLCPDCAAWRAPRARLLQHEDGRGHEKSRAQRCCEGQRGVRGLGDALWPGDNRRQDGGGISSYWPEDRPSAHAAAVRTSCAAFRWAAFRRLNSVPPAAPKDWCGACFVGQVRGCVGDEKLDTSSLPDWLFIGASTETRGTCSGMALAPSLHAFAVSALAFFATASGRRAGRCRELEQGRWWTFLDVTIFNAKIDGFFKPEPTVSVVAGAHPTLWLLIAFT